jgi:hypothetical protein
MKVDEHTCSWAHWSTKGRIGSFGHVGTQRGKTNPNVTMVHEVKFRVHIRAQGTQPRSHEGREQDQHQSSEVDLDKRGELPQGAKSLHMGGIVLS